MGSAQLDVGLGNSSHANLIKGTTEESCKGAHKWNSALAAAASNGDTDQVLLSNEALDEALREGLLEGDGKCAVLGVTVHGNYTLAALSQLLDGSAISHTSSNLDKRS